MNIYIQICKNVYKGIFKSEKNVAYMRLSLMGHATLMNDSLHNTCMGWIRLVGSLK